MSKDYSDITIEEQITVLERDLLRRASEGRTSKSLDKTQLRREYDVLHSIYLLLNEFRLINLPHNKFEDKRVEE